METITFTCEVITPMFMNGADGSTPELRPPGIKAAMRFWWRALHGHLLLSELKKQEGEIFGDNNNRSKFSIQVKTSEIRKGSERPVPHKNYRSDCIAVGSTFEVTLLIPVETPRWNMEKCGAIFELACILGGTGKRARRGMGSVEVTHCSAKNWKKEQIDLTYILQLINNFSPYYSLRADRDILHSYAGTMQYYPWLKKVELGKVNNSILQQISDTTHRLKERNPQAYEASLGHASGGRFASPVYVSVVKGSLRPVVATLNTVPDRHTGDISLRLQDEFKQSILD
ncbi:MAG: type III-B CRISPR module RAMP protein Cmr1 [Saprospiraceae bacterium]|nr:type III-B CRISPR module RAMP protein Cmr1 [Saprospiraceae bacterium]MDZ4705208.1 type III-B CRISPR module RAMP protein Cmr1 [Saprospiraceae bacterium]